MVITFFFPLFACLYNPSKRNNKNTHTKQPHPTLGYPVWICCTDFGTVGSGL